MACDTDDRKTVFRKIVSPEELQTVNSLAWQIFPETYKDILSGTQIPYMMDMMYSPDVLEKEFSGGMQFALICDGEKPVGYVSWHAFDCEGTPAVKLEKLYLSFACHGRSIGFEALNYVINEAASGCSAVYLNVNKFNLRAQKAYRRAGFEICREEKNPIGNGYYMDDYVMKRVICP